MPSRTGKLDKALRKPIKVDFVSQEEVITAYRRNHLRRIHMRGYSIQSHREAIAELIKQTGAKTALDYGCGKGKQYSVREFHLEWGIEQPYCYDPGLERFSIKPKKGRIFDAVLCVDVLEHIFPDNIEETLKEIIDYADKFVFLVITTVIARKKFSNKQNMHLIVENEDWWNKLIAKCKGDKDIIISAVYDNKVRKIVHRKKFNEQGERV